MCQLVVKSGNETDIHINEILLYQLKLCNG